MSSDEARQRASVGRSFVLALVVGLLAAYIAARIPVLGLPLALGTPIALTVRARLVDRDRSRMWAETGGVLLGSGGLFLFGAANTIVACEGTTDFCGNANVVPLLALAVAMIILGMIISAGTYRAIRTDRR